MRKTALALVFAALALGASGCSKKAVTESAVTIDPTNLQPFEPLPSVMASDTNPITEEKVALGRMLYFDKRLSRSQQIACNSCHDLDQYGVDGKPTSDGHKGQKGSRNSPTVYNAAGHFVQFWDGRAATVEEQAKGPVLNPAEMAMPGEKQVVATLKSMPEYRAAFKKAFPQDKNPVTYSNMAKAIGAFERKLVTPSRWDRFLGGDQSALTDAEKTGFNIYVETGCQVCHLGSYVGGDLYQKLGAAKPWADISDVGREQVTKASTDRLFFKVPSLRNIDKTGPYFHNGKIATLEDAVATMAEYQLGEKLTDIQVKSIVTWLKSLTGEIPSDYIKEPALPKSTARTPKPDMTI